MSLVRDFSRRTLAKSLQVITRLLPKVELKTTQKWGEKRDIKGKQLLREKEGQGLHPRYKEGHTKQISRGLGSQGKIEGVTEGSQHWG